MSSRLKFSKEDSDYDPTDSDDDYDENEKILLNKVRKKQSKDSDSEDQVFGVGSEDDDDDVSDIALSDVEGQEEKDELPDVRAWGKDKRKFYSTDYVDADYGGFQGQDAHFAELEEEEAKTLQQQLAQQLDDEDFMLETSTKHLPSKDKTLQEVIKSDLSKLSTRQHLEILQKESPEFFGLVQDFQGKMEIVKQSLEPFIVKYKKGQVANSLVVEFVTTYKELILNYCVNIYMYILLKASRVVVQNHPIVKRLYQYRQLLLQLEPIYDTSIKSQIESNEIIEVSQEPLNVSQENPVKERKPKKVKLNVTIDSEKQVVEENANDVEQEKRAITYKMAKNKGLTPHRKKEQRNPRVKHRNKFKKAKIRRKGAIREPRTEMSRYGGETSGIKATVSKSIKIKT